MSGFRRLLPKSSGPSAGFVPLHDGGRSATPADDGSGFTPGFQPLVPGRMGAELVKSSEPREVGEDESVEPQADPESAEIVVEEEEVTIVEDESVSESPEDIGILRAREEGFEIGRAEGLASGTSEITAQVERLQGLAAELESLRREIFERSVADVAAAVHHIARVVVHRELLLDSTGVKALVIDVLEHVQTKDEVLIRVSPEDWLAMQNEAPNLLNQLGRDASFHIQSDPELSPGGARIETQLGAIDASVETRFAAFADALAEWAGEEASVDVIRP